MQSFQRISGYVSSVKNKVTSTSQSIWQNHYVQDAFQGITAPVYSSASFVTNKITSTAQSIWQNDAVQATCQGLLAPIYSYESFNKLRNNSKALQTALSRTYQLNRNYALQALGLYFVYYRMLHPASDYFQHKIGSESWSGSATQCGLYGIDLMLYVAMIGYLTRLQLLNTVDNIAYTSTITNAAGKVMEPSKDFKPCDSKECSSVQVGRADVDSVIFYVLNRYVVAKSSQAIESYVPGYYGKALAFGMEAVSIGWPLVEYKFSALGRCSMHKYKEMLSSYKTYCVMYGASFVAATWGSYQLLSMIPGEKNPYIYDAVFSYMFQLYALLAIAREKKFPGNDHMAIDLIGWAKYFAEQPITLKILEKILGPYSSVEKMVQNPSVGLLLSERDFEINQGLDSLIGGIEHIKELQSSRFYNAAKWISGLLPYQIIPDEVQTVCKSVSKTALTKFFRRAKDLLELARAAEMQRGEQQAHVMPDTIDNYIPNPVNRSEQKNNVNQEVKLLPVMQVIQTDLRMQIPEFKPKTVPPLEKIKSQVIPLPIESKPATVTEVKQVIKDKRLDPGLENMLHDKDIVVDSAYFVESKVTVKERAVLPVAHNSVRLFAKKEIDVFDRSNQSITRKNDPLASLTASLISNTARQRASR
jgi:hypothetical protein